MRSAENMTSIELVTDAELVAACLAGDREAFGWIVERYQRLLCSPAYSATGSLSESEDVAQEAFVDAWRQLGTLHERENCVRGCAGFCVTRSAGCVARMDGNPCGRRSRLIWRRRCRRATSQLRTSRWTRRSRRSCGARWSARPNCAAPLILLKLAGCFNGIRNPRRALKFEADRIICRIQNGFEFGGLAASVNDIAQA